MNAVNQVQEASAVYAVEQHALLKGFDLLATAPEGVARLRELILSLAVQGKLVPQDPEDEPASVLLERIRAEKQALIKAGKLKKDKPLAEIAEEEKPFELPDSWEWARLGEITNFGTTTKAEKIEDDVWVLDLEDIEKETSKIRQRVKYADRRSLSDKNAFEVGDVLYGKLRPYLNKVVVADQPGVCTTEILPLRCHGPYSPHYFRLVLSSPHFLSYVNSKSYGMKMPRLGTEDGRKALVPLAPLAEQSRIVARVEELMRLCDALEQQGKLEAAQHARLVGTLFDALANSESAHALAENWQRVAATFDLLLDRPEAVDALEQTLLQLAVRGLLVPQDPKDEPASELLKKIRQEKDHLIATGKLKRDKPLPDISEEEKPFELPQGWEWGYAADLCALITDGDHLPPPKVESGIPFLVIGDVISGEVDTSRASRFVPEEYFAALGWQKQPLDGDVLYTTVGSYGIPIPVTSGACFCFQRHIALFRPAIRATQEYLALILKSTFVYDQATECATGIAQKTVPLSGMRRFKVPVPPLAEQSRIVARVAELRQLCADLRARLSAARSTQTRLAEALVAQAA